MWGCSTGRLRGLAEAVLASLNKVDAAFIGGSWDRDASSVSRVQGSVAPGLEAGLPGLQVVAVPWRRLIHRAWRMTFAAVQQRQLS